MRSLVIRSLAASATTALLSLSASARAQQTDTNPPPPNVLILLDNSGSMERMIDGNTPEAEGANCNFDPTTGAPLPVAAPLPNRWGVMVQALTGTFQNNYNCISMPRTPGSVFTNEYQIGHVNPYDTSYYLNHHRPVFSDNSTTPPTACVIAPGALPGASPGLGVGPNGTGAGARAPGSGAYATDFPTDGIIMRPYNQLSVVTTPTSGACSQFTARQYTNFQYQDGAIPSSSALMRFGLMTFDQDTSASIGVTAGSSPTVVSPGYVDTVAPTSPFTGAFAGMWSYYPGWNGTGACPGWFSGGRCPAQGMPNGCSNGLSGFTVGARNPAAPPWEGRMMTFPNTNDLLTQQQYNQNVVNVVLASRPYGATPLAGMMEGAEYYLWNDPAGPEQSDPLVHCGERPQYIIVLTDGAPNLDMTTPDTTGCNAGTGVCPFVTPDQTASALFMGTGNTHSVTTYVVGFAVSSYNSGAGLAQCASLVTGGNLSAACVGVSGSSPFAACCELQKIALAGSNNQTSAFFADTPGALQQALNSILGQIAKNATTRTTPSYAPASTNVLSNPTTPSTVGDVYLASFNPSPGLPWTGDVLRQRQQCTMSMGKYTVPGASVDPTQGDNFGMNLNSNAGPARTFIAFQPDPIAGTGAVDATATIRPYVLTTVGDGLGKYSATTYSGAATTVISNITSAALNINQPCQYTSSTTHAPASPPLTPANCTVMTLDYTFGQQSFTGNPGNFPFVSRFGSALGDIFHAAPIAVPPPGTLLQEASYQGFQNLWQKRDSIVYVATNDGLLHAFWADETKLENNERWAMLMPAVMPSLLGSYPSSHELLLDGAPVVKDVAWDRTVATAGDPTKWHTMLVAGYGSSNQGYYAVDVTNPNPSQLQSGTVPLDPPAPGPVFRWQLTKMPATNYPIFGSQSATPAVTTLFMDPHDGNGAREIGVAILPGGGTGAPTTSATSGTACVRATKTSDSQPVGAYAYRSGVRCWGPSQKATDPVPGRSLSIVRLDTGEILDVFARKADAQAYPGDTLLKAGRIIDTPLDSPMTGTPLIYPSDVGADTTKIFISDADGTMWRFDVSNSDPTQWVGEVFLDLYNQTVDTNATAWADGQPLQVQPTLSLDPSGEVVIDAASGTTDTFDSTGVDFLYSITEKVQGTTPKLRAFVNWYLGNPLTPSSTMPSAPPTPQTLLPVAPLLPGERVSGPMTVFDGTLYFSTYAATPTPPAGQQVMSCQPSVARVWGLDYATPNATRCPDPTLATCDRSQGGSFRLLVNGSTQPPVANITPYATDKTLASAVIPGVSIQVTPACASGGTPGTDQYVPGATHSTPSNFTSGSYSLFTQVGANNKGGSGAQTLSMSLPTPSSPTMIDSWAPVLE